MARIITNIEYDSYFWVDWSQVSQDTTANKTRINWSYGVYCGHRFETSAIKGYAFSINGVQVYSGGTYSNYSRGDHTIASGTLEIQHEDDGTKTLNISAFSGWLYSNHNYTAGASSHELTPIPRKAIITASSDFTDQENPSITFSNPGGFTMDVWLEPNPNGDHLCVRNNIPNDGGYTWILTDEERDQLRSKCPGTECTIRVGLYTHIGDTVDADYRDKKFTMVESDATRPAVKLTASQNNGFKGLYVQGKSKVDIAVEGEGKYGATIRDLYASVDGKTYKSDSFTSDVFTNSGEVKITGYAVDSRGFTGTAEAKVTVQPYSKPLVVPIGNENAIQCYRSDADGKRSGSSTRLWVKAARSYYDVSGKNTCTLQWRSKLSTASWEDDTWEVLLSDTDTTDEFSDLTSGEFALDKSYNVQIRAIDDVGEYDIKTFEIPTRDVALHLGAGGKRVSVGSYCIDEEYTFHCEWKAIFDSDIIVQGMTLADYIKSVINEGG